MDCGRRCPRRSRGRRRGPGGPLVSLTFRYAAQAWALMRAEFEVVREAAYRAASDDCNGVLLNARGKRAGIDSYSLFMGQTARAHAYASEELREHWTTHTRPTLCEFERQTFEQAA